MLMVEDEPRELKLCMLPGELPMFISAMVFTIFLTLLPVKKNIPHAILIRAIEPRDGINIMLQRRNKNKVDLSLTAGPGSLTKALGITVVNSGVSLMDNLIWLEDQNIHYTNQDIFASPRVGVQYAGKDAKNSWRFRIENSPYVSPTF